MKNYFNVSNVYECGRNNPELSSEIVCMATEDNEYFTDIFDIVNTCQYHHEQILSSKKIKEAVLRIIDEEEEDIKCNINIVTCDTPFKYPVTKSVQKKDASWWLERWIAAGVLAKNVEIFKGCSIQSDKQFEEIIDSEEHVDAKNWLRNDSSKQVEVTNDSENWLWMEVI